MLHSLILKIVKISEWVVCKKNAECDADGLSHLIYM